MQPIAIITATLLSLTSAVHCAQDSLQLVQTLQKLIEEEARTPSLGPSLQGFDPLKLAAVDAGESALSMCQTYLLPGVDSRARSRAIRALSTIGGESAVALLRDQQLASGSTFERSAYSSALASTGTVEDIQYLISGLEGEHFGRDWTPIVTAALTLGILRAEEAIPALEISAAKAPGSAASAAAEEALKWIRMGYWQVDMPTGTDADQAIAVVIRNGIPRMDWTTCFYDRDRMQYWHREDDRWRLGDDAVEDAPTIWIRAHVSPDSTRALVTVGMVFGPLNGKGYDYILRKTENNWKVTAIFSTWIS